MMDEQAITIGYLLVRSIAVGQVACAARSRGADGWPSMSLLVPADPATDHPRGTFLDGPGGVKC